MGLGSHQKSGQFTTLSEINVTPLVDVMLVLLVIFMVGAGVESAIIEERLQDTRVERDRVPRPPEEVENPLKEVPIVVPNTNVKKVLEHEAKEPRVVLDASLVFRLDATLIVDCKEVDSVLKANSRRVDDASQTVAFEKCARLAAAKLGPNVRIQDKKRVNFAADRTIPWGWATRFMAIMGNEHGIKQVNIVVTHSSTPEGR